MSLIPALAPSCVSTADAEQVLHSIQNGTASLVVCYGTIRSLLKERDALKREQTAASEVLADAAMQDAMVKGAADTISRLQNTLNVVDDETKRLSTALAQCRDAFPVPPPGSPLEALWAPAIGCPEAVGDYVPVAAGVLRRLLQDARDALAIYAANMCVSSANGLPIPNHAAQVVARIDAHMEGRDG